jgi:AraC-like DNA-binding protein
MPKLLIRALMISGLLMVGIMIGVVGGRLPVFASMNLFPNNSSADTANGDYCHLYETTLANNLHVSTSDLEAANKDALQKTIDQLARDGKITPAEQLALDAEVQKYGSDPCNGLPQAAADLMNNPMLKQQLAQIHTQLVNAVAPSLQLAPSTLEYELSQGKTIAQIAQEQHLTVTDANTAYLKSVQGILSQYVQNQTITQDQSDLLYNLITQAVANGQYPLLQEVK